MQAADVEALTALPGALDPSFSLYKRQHWQRVVREEIAPWFDSITARSSVFSVDDVTRLDLLEVTQLLREPMKAYPGSMGWLSRRVDDANSGSAVAHTARVNGTLAGIAIGTPKGQRFKISTLFVTPGQRGLGFGRMLLRAALANIPAGTEEAYLTCATAVAEELAPLLASEQFALIATEQDRYGDGRHENVYVRPVGHSSRPVPAHN